jgi:hypothetical protein
MTLLLYATTASGDQPSGAAFTQLCHVLAERYELAFTLVATRGVTGWVPVSDRRDWVTLPAPTGLWPRSDEAAARLLLTYAKQFRPCASIFLGNDAARLRDACAKLGDGSSALGCQMLLEQDDFLLQPIFELLDRELPASVVVRQTSDTAAFGAALDRHRGAGVRLYWDGPPSHRVIELLDVAQQRTSGAVWLQFVLNDISKHPAASLKILPHIVRRAPRVRVTVVAEGGVYRSVARTMSMLSSALYRHRSR